MTALRTGERCSFSGLNSAHSPVPALSCSSSRDRRQAPGRFRICRCRNECDTGFLRLIATLFV
ncbi:MAG: hypothetical protein E2603_21660 [Achromobacter sp.]|nr:hypothetical protein [Achromobacter sp.]